MDEKKYLDLVGLAHYDEKIKAYIKSNGSDVTDKLIDVIGVSELAEGEKTLIERIADNAKAVADEEQARKDQIGDLGKQELPEDAPEGTEAADHTVKSYVDAAIAAVNSDAEILEGRVDDLESAVETLTGEGEGSVKKAAEDATAAAVAQLISDSEENPIDEKFDTLKEIADWILSSDENAEALNAAERLDNLETAIGTPAKPAEPSEEEGGEEKPAEPATGLYKEIEDVEEKIDAFVRITESEIDALFEEETKNEEDGI